MKIRQRIPDGKTDEFTVTVPHKMGEQIRDKAKKLEVSHSVLLSELIHKSLTLFANNGIWKCKTCGRLLIPSRSDQIYCSSPCKQQAYRLRNVYCKATKFNWDFRNFLLILHQKTLRRW